MDKTVATILPLRFLSLLLHFSVTVLVNSTKETYLEVALKPWGNPARLARELSDAQFNFDWLLGASLACFAVEFLGLLMGVSLRRVGVATFATTLHFCGAFLLFWFALEGWTYTMFLPLFVLFSLLPTIPEAVLLCVFVFKSLNLDQLVDVRM